MAANVVAIRPTVAIRPNEPNPRQRTLPPIPPVPAELAGEMGHRTALYLIIGLSLSRTVGGEFWLPETGSPVADGNYFARLGSWQSRGCGSPATQRRIRQRLIDLGLMHVRRAGLPARLHYRFDVGKCERFLASFGCWSAPKAPAAHVQPNSPAADSVAVAPKQELELPKPELSQRPLTDDSQRPLTDEECDNIDKLMAMAAPGIRNPGGYRVALERRAREGKLEMPSGFTGSSGPSEAGPRPDTGQIDIDVREAENDLRHWRRLAQLRPDEPNIQEAISSAERRLAEARESAQSEAHGQQN